MRGKPIPVRLELSPVALEQVVALLANPPAANATLRAAAARFKKSPRRRSPTRSPTRA